MQMAKRFRTSMRKVVTFVLAYSFFATSVWSLALPVENNGRGEAVNRMSWSALSGPLGNLSRGARRNFDSLSTGIPVAAAPKVFTNFAALNAPAAMVQATGGVSSSISSNFNATAIPAGDVIWFSAVLKLNGTVPENPVSIAVQNSIIQFTAGSTNYSLNAPKSVVTFSPAVTTTTATFDTANNPAPVWLQNQLNPQPSGNTLLQAFAFPVPAGGLPGGIKNVTWSNTFSSDTANISLNWQWAAAVYTGCVSTIYNSDDVKPTDDTSTSIYKNSDHAGTPEACKNFVTQGATGGGASNYTGSLSGTASVTPPVAGVSPVITGSISPSPNGNGWNNSNVTVSFACSDANFAIATCPAPVAVNTEGAGQVITGTAVDQTGSTAATSVTVNLDKTSPSITAAATASSGGGSVLTLPVTVTFTCADTLSGVASCPSPIQVTTPGAHEVFSGTTTDKAGNTATASISITTELAPLAMTASLTPSPLNGWNNTSVSVGYKCTGGVLPVQCPQGTTVSGEGAGQVISATAIDAAGQSATLNTIINIDETPPTITATATPDPNAAGWNTTDVTITYACSDVPSGVAFCPPQQVVSNDGKGQQITASASDVAGNTNSAVPTIINLEKTAPGITASAIPAANAAGWNNSDVTVQFSCTQSVSDIVTCPQPVYVTSEGKDQEVSGTVTDEAGKFNTAPVHVSLDKTPPSIAITTPVTLPIAVSYSDSGSGIDTASFKLTIDGIDHTGEFTVTATGATGSPATALGQGSHVITATVSDIAGNTSPPATATLVVEVADTTPPTISITTPTDGSLTNNNRPPIAVSYSDVGSGIDVASFKLTIDSVDHTADLTATATGASGSPAVALLDGNHSIVATVSDRAGNTSQPATANVTIATVPPQITINQPPDQSFTNANSVTVSVTVTSAAPITAVLVNGVTASLSNGTFTAPVSLGANGPQAIVVSATDEVGNTAAKTVTVNIDRTPPTITLTTPDTITPLHAGQITATVQDSISVTQVVISVNSTVLATLTSPPYEANLSVPTGANPGDTLTVTATVTDLAGNTASAVPHSVRVAADGNGVIVGQVLDDVTGLPLGNASVQMIPATGLPIQTDDQGRYSLQASSNHLFLSVNTPPSPPTLPTGTTTVEREVFVLPGVGTVPIDARLTTLAQGVSIGSGGGTLSSGAISISVPANSVSEGTTFQLTSLSGQGLPNLLPLGWSELAAFDLRSSGLPTNLVATVGQLPNTVAYLVTYSPALHAWTMVTPTQQPANGSVTFPVPGVGAFAIVAPDTTTPSIPIPDQGGALTGIAVQALDPAVSGAINLNPPVLPAGGGTSMATVNLQAPTLSPSGTVIQANVSEKFSLASGDTVSEEIRSEDIVLYNALVSTGPAMVAQFPLTPSHKYTNAQLVSGNLHVDILSGREGVRGTPGGNDPVTVSDGSGIATLAVPGAALGVDTAISVESTALEDFVPTSSSMSPIQEVLVDFSGEILNTPAQLSIPSTGLDPSHTFLLTQVQRINGVPHMVAVAVAQINGSNLTSVASPGLPGVTHGGEYVFYDIASPAGFVTGVAKMAAGPVQALVQTDSLQIVSITAVDGRYIIPALVNSALAGTVNLRANGTTSSLAGTASTQLSAGQTATVDIQLTGVVNTATVTPADGSLGVPASAIITITSPVAIDPATVVPGNVALFQGTSTTPGPPVSLLSRVLSVSGTVLTLTPAQNLDPATQYTLQVSGLADKGQGAIVVPASSFTTKANQPLTFDPNAITFAFPDQNGNIHVSAPAGSLPPGTKVLIIDQSNAVVLSLTAFNDGSLSGDFPGTINDVLQVTVTDPNGASASFTRSQFVAADGSVAVGPGGGTVTGPGGVAMIIPEGALDQGAVFTLQPLGQDAFPQLPNVPGINFGSGMKITAPSMPFSKREIKLAFPKPANAPANAFYYVYRQITDENNNVYFETIDHAFVQGTGSSAQVVTASPPFCGFMNFYGNFQRAASASFSSSIIVPIPSISDNIFILWDQIQNFDANQPGIASQGLIVGKALQTIPPGPGQTEPTFAPLQGAIVWLGSSKTQPSQNVAITSNACGEFTIFDPQLGGGPRTVTAQSPTGVILQSTANEVNGIQVDDATFDVTAGLENQYRNIGHINFTFPPTTPPPPPPQVDIRLFTLAADNSRIFASNTLTSGTPLVIAFKSALQVTGAEIAGAQLTIQPDYLDNQKDIQPALDFRAIDPSSGDVLHNYVTGSPGAYTLNVTAVSPLGGPPVTVSKSFLVVAAGGTNNMVTPAQAPLVIGTIPLQNAKRVPTTIFPEVTFSEPVTNVTGNLSFADAAGNQAPVSLIGVRADGSVANPVGSSDAITSLTIRPSTGLKFNTPYTLTLFFAIVDQNTPPLHLQPYSLQFTTLGPQELDSNTNRLSSTRPLIIGQRAYVGEFAGPALSAIDVFSIEDPTTPVDEGLANFFEGHVVDIAGLASSPVDRCLSEVPPGAQCPRHASGGPLIAMAATTGATDTSIPSNIFLYDVSDPDHPARVGAVSATTSAVQDGSLLRIVMKDQFVFASTFHKGLQMIDLQQAVNDFQQTPATQFGQAVSIDGNGFALDAVVNTIPIPVSVPNGTGGFIAAPATMWDLKAGDFATQQPTQGNPSVSVPTQTLIVATGRIPFVVADPQQGGLSAVLYPMPDSTGVGLSQQPLIDLTGQTKLQLGRAVALGSVPIVQLVGGVVNRPIAVVVGSGTANGSGASLLMVVDMTDPKHPLPQGSVQLEDQSGQPVPLNDVILKGSLALVGTQAKKVLLVDVTDPTRPLLAGEIDGTLGDRLALTDDGILVTSSGNPVFGGVHTASFGNPCATYRALLRDNPPPLPQISATPQLGWSMSGGLAASPEGVLLDRDGLVLTNIMLGRRKLAQAISLPYFLIQRSNDSDPNNPPRCELLNDPRQNACSGLAPGVSARSRLLTFTARPPDGSSFTYEAQFLIDRLDGDPDEDSTVPDSCVLLTQHYEFRKEGLAPLEPFGKLAAARFLPELKYSYFTDPGGPQINALTTAQRLHFDARTPSLAGQKAAANATLLSCDPEPQHPSWCIPGILQGLGNGPTSGLLAGLGGDTGVLAGNNPLLTEQYVTVIKNGTMNLFTDPVRATAFGPVQTVVDNLHFAPTPVGNPDQSVDEPGFTTFGCPACVHVHWRWSSVLDPSNLEAGLLGIDPLFVNNPVDPSHPGLPMLPPGATQDVDMAILRAGGAEEQHPNSVRNLFQTQSTQPVLGPSVDPEALKNSGTTPVFWYIATGHKPSDQFFLHGGGLATFYVNRIIVPRQGQGLLAINVEHSRAVDYVIQGTVTDQTGVDPNTGNPTFLTSSFTQQGTLEVGTDDIAGPAEVSFVPDDGLLHNVTVTVTLTDQTLAPRDIFQRTFEFSSPGTQEP